MAMRGICNHVSEGRHVALFSLFTGQRKNQLGSDEGRFIFFMFDIICSVSADVTFETSQKLEVLNVVTEVAETWNFQNIC